MVFAMAFANRTRFLQRWLQSLVSGVPELGPRWPRIIIGAVGDSMRSGLHECLRAGNFFPIREGHFVLQCFATPGTSLPEMRASARDFEELLRTSILTVLQQIGRAELGEDAWDHMLRISR